MKSDYFLFYITFILSNIDIILATPLGGTGNYFPESSEMLSPGMIITAIIMVSWMVQSGTVSHKSDSTRFS